MLAAVVLSGAQPASKQASKELGRLVEGALDEWVQTMCKQG